ncbi:EmrB/QacA subfamily drug resistance transporter [Stackebrandtia albiflava]|uniref:EmrB/QacA subfamily drug resistance transporter n=1 Tax=Stackebrandtia albiflava TaxID=406432 RepID=A0A562V0N9_9ACTN|nr:DHA2 family efflux MFS transporter permease subunit [Stackebrandtia albiflava]TWJ11486.1 EmrB/QacA subfamily drug resistance transporter [Stackebrandtia albiflava]
MPERTGPWPALWSLVIGFFMLLVDSTIVSVAMPAIMSGLGADITEAVWVTSAYLLAYAVPLLITGRLGDRYGPKNVYLAGLAVFTASSAWCGFAGTVESLIVARVVQGLGAAMMTPQTMAVITRTFPPDRRGTAMGLWGSVAGVATLVGPVVGGLLVDGLGWEWIFFINVPVGVVGWVLAFRLVPVLPTHVHSFDVPGVILSAVGLFCLVFGIQEGETFDWGTIVGPVSVWSLVATGLVVLAVFVAWQRWNRREPLVPLRLFADRNFSLANVAINGMGFAVTGMALPLMLYAQLARGFSPTQAALLMAPMAVISGVLAPVVGRLVDRMNPKYLAAGGFACMIAGLVWLGAILSPDVPVWSLLLPVALLGFGNAGVWAPLSTSATRNLPPALAGAGSGVYNTTRQFGAVLGSAGIAAMMNARLAVHVPGMDTADAGGGETDMPGPVRDAFSLAMGESLLLPATVLVVGFVVVWWFAAPTPRAAVAGWHADSR